MKSIRVFLFDCVILVVLITGGYFLYQNHNRLLDSYYLRNYTPPAEIKTLADQATLTDEGRRLFYRASPEISAQRADLVENCHVKDDKTIELGCYLSTDKIYLLSIDQPELKSEVMVTAAHETLHAAYDRMSNKDKTKINAELESYAASITRQEFLDRMNDYARTEPGERDNELHSIIGTEYGNLPAPLEEHYAQYFHNRSTIVASSDKFRQTFDGLHLQIVELDAQIKATKAQMQALLATNQIRTYNTLVPSINGKISTYNDKVVLYNKYAGELLGKESAAGAQ